MVQTPRGVYKEVDDGSGGGVTPEIKMKAMYYELITYHKGRRRLCASRVSFPPF